ncbi:hypothetical protein BP6252_03323 [Coleophoma cylindrospora]|uniref:Small-subunit processome Utp12 domain-containing protein n=1 Tax=Coleophoma cylindrospora TaxID=1849047 RepID=A0A3D8S7Y2_9HELO|nr:hypothetical protein BP6252_03323 [Coleophoma cylindrospora]
MSTKRKISTKLGQPMVKPSAKAVGKAFVDESRTVATTGHAVGTNGFKDGEVVDISSDSSSNDSDHSDDEVAASEPDDAGEEDVAMGDTQEAGEGEDGEGAAEPSFGDLVRANAAEPIDVAGAFDDPSTGALSYPQGARLQAPTGASLGTVLSQALKTNDISLLESCLQVSDTKTIRSTIQRLDSPLAGTLLQKLAERIHRRPGRSGSLMVWVQWTLVTHGGYLATQPNLVKKLSQLNRVLDDRSRSINNLLSLKGKLDMLEAQIELRRSMQKGQQGFDEEEDEEDVIYVEGQEDEDEESAMNSALERMARNGELDDFSGSEDSEDMPMVNGAVADSEDDEESEDGDMIDDEAEETDADSGDEDEVDHEDMDSQGDSDSDAAAAPPTKLQRIGGMFSRGKK